MLTNIIRCFIYRYFIKIITLVYNIICPFILIGINYLIHNATPINVKTSNCYHKTLWSGAADVAPFSNVSCAAGPNPVVTLPRAEVL